MKNEGRVNEGDLSMIRFVYLSMGASGQGLTKSPERAELDFVSRMGIEELANEIISNPIAIGWG